VVLLILAGLWAVVLVPPLLRARTERSGDSIGDFNYRLDVLSRTNGAPATRTGRRLPAPGSAAKRRRDVLRVLIGSVTLTLMLAFVSGAAALWALHVVADVLLGSYLLLWAWVRSAQAERERVEYLPRARTPELALRRTGSS